MNYVLEYLYSNCILIFWAQSNIVIKLKSCNWSNSNW